MASLATSDLLPRPHDEALRVEPAVPPRSTDPDGPTVPDGQVGPGLPGAPQRGDLANTDLADMSLEPHGPRARRTVPADPHVSLGPLGWLAVLLVAVLLTVLAHAASVRSSQAEQGEPSLFTDPAYVLAQ